MLESAFDGAAIFQCGLQGGQLNKVPGCMGDPGKELLTRVPQHAVTNPDPSALS